MGLASSSCWGHQMRGPWEELNEMVGAFWIRRRAQGCGRSAQRQVTSHETWTAPRSQKPIWWAQKVIWPIVAAEQSFFLWEERTSARHENTTTRERKEKKKEKRMNPHVTDLQDPIVEAQSSAPPGWLRDTRASLPGPWEELRRKPSHHFLSVFSRKALTGSRSHSQVSCYILQTGLSKGWWGR